MESTESCPAWSKVCADYIRRAEEELFAAGTPADRFLARCFREDRRCGSRDRRRIRDAVFQYFRYRGLLKGKISPPTAMLLAENRFSELECPGEEKIPEWTSSELCAECRNSYPDQCLTRHPVWIRRKIGENSAVKPPVPGIPQAFPLTEEEAKGVKESPEYRSGKIELQDLSSQCIGRIAMPQPGDLWWDACAGAGGKTLQLADLMENRGTVVSSDIREGFTEKERRNRVLRAGAETVLFRTLDASEQLPDEGEKQFNGVYADVPCSSSGRWRRNPEAKWILKKETLTELCRLQRTILHNVSRAVRPGGVLIYATCSLFQCEDREAVDSFLAAHPEFVLEPFPDPLTGKTTDGTILIDPGTADSDGAFGARFRRRKDT